MASGTPLKEIIEIIKIHVGLMSYTVGSHKYAPPPLFYMLASGKTGEGAYARDRDIST